MALVQATDCFSYRGVVYSPGLVIDDGEEVVRRYPSMFRLAGQPADDAPVERATARPGEKRATKRPAKKAADDE